MIAIAETGMPGGKIYIANTSITSEKHFFFGGGDFKT